MYANRQMRWLSKTLKIFQKSIAIGSFRSPAEWNRRLYEKHQEAQPYMERRDIRSRLFFIYICTRDKIQLLHIEGWIYNERLYFL
ncbi:hypothetical protein FZC83_13590 [Rossellomorea marisflavi]|uniref:Uncharacterized protein n=1 Tax=Rossellomorea marisflavi TaxID=189381 RepID=A0A5D4RSJ3_9BACI|nr:hypothetical protein FZC83_13590 [Rossellomorea marisflavi]